MLEGDLDRPALIPFKKYNLLFVDFVRIRSYGSM